MKKIFVSILTLLIMSGCAVTQRDGFDICALQSYRDVPGVTEEEIDAIENLKINRKSFSYGSMIETEAFLLEDGTCAGFTTDFCELLSTLFGIDFVLEIFEWEELSTGINDMSIDFSGDFTPDGIRRSTYNMTSPIVERTQRIFTLKGFDKITDEESINGLKIGFLKNSIDHFTIQSSYPHLDYQIAFVEDFEDAVEALRIKKIDAFVGENVVDPFFEKYGFIESKAFFPMAYTPVSLTTANDELEPIISVMNKYLAAGGFDVLLDMYKEGEYEYAKYKLFKSFTEEETDYLEKMTRRSRSVKLAYENDNYPICFYNEKTEQFEGIAPDILSEISKLTGIEFKNETTKDTRWPEILSKLKSGEISIMSELLYSEEREADYIRSTVPYSSSDYALLSKTDYPNQELYQVYRSTVGIVSQYANVDIYKKRFPDSDNFILFDSVSDAFAALEKGDIDLFMSTEQQLLRQTNYLEKPGFKVNLRFNIPAESAFGFNKNEAVLRSIIDKAQPFVKTEAIVTAWTTRIFDYSRTYANERAVYLSIFVAILFIAMIIAILLFLHNKGLSANLEVRTATLSAMFKSIPDIIFCKDMNLSYTSCNAAFEEFAGLSEAEIIGKNSLEIFANIEAMGRSFYEIDKRVIEENSVQTVEEWFTYPNGKKLLMETTKTPLIQNGVTVGLLGISRNITEHKIAIENAMAASQAKSMFLAHMSHEIRTPMNAIVGMAELNLRREMQPDIYENTLNIKHAGANLLSIINDILDFSKIEAGMLEILPEEYALVSLINDVISIIRMRLTEKPLLLAANVDCNTPGKLVGDESRIRQILLNILSNAVKYTNEGFVTISLTSTVKQDIAELNIKIADSGTGIKKEDMDKLFTDFIQFDNSKGVQGTGLGLAITKSLCLAMGGDISAESEYGIGSTFTITLPQKINTYERFASVDKPEKKNSLIFEARSVYALSIKESLENLDVKCKVVSTLAEFSERLNKSRYPFVFISSLLFEEASHILNSLDFRSKLVLITEFGESAPAQNIITLTMPAHSLTIANILDDVSAGTSYNAVGKTNILFTAPSAKVLIVDDVATNLKVAEGLMSPYKMDIHTCKSGAEALRLAARNQYDIIFMDHMMPVMDGVEATAKIRSMDDNGDYYKNVPIIALTANAVTGMKDMFLQNGFDDFLAKPIETPKLNSILEKWIPKEKRGKFVEENQMSAAFEIDGIDIKAGISSAGGIDNYLITLAAFHKDGWDKVSAIADCLSKEDIKQYTANIQELHSAAARIGARRMSDLSRTLEIAGKSGALSFVKENNEDLIAELKALLQNIKTALMNIPNDRSELVEINDNFLISKLQSLKDSIEQMDAGLTDKILSELGSRSWDAETSVTIENISTYVLMFEYDEAVGLIDKLLTALSRA